MKQGFSHSDYRKIQKKEAKKRTKVLRAKMEAAAAAAAHSSGPADGRTGHGPPATAPLVPRLPPCTVDAPEPPPRPRYDTWPRSASVFDLPVGRYEPRVIKRREVDPKVFLDALRAWPPPFPNDTEARRPEEDIMLLSPEPAPSPPPPVRPERATAPSPCPPAPLAASSSNGLGHLRGETTSSAAPSISVVSSPVALQSVACPEVGRPLSVEPQPLPTVSISWPSPVAGAGRSVRGGSTATRPSPLQPATPKPSSPSPATMAGSPGAYTCANVRTRVDTFTSVDSSPDRPTAPAKSD